MEFSQEEFDEILSIFNQESEEIIHRLNNNILELEKNPQNKNIIVELFRDAHSLKGAARMIGFNDIQAIAHKIEDILGFARDEKISINSEITDVIYQSIDFINLSIGLSIKAKKEVKLNDYAKFIKSLNSIISDATTQKNDEENIIDLTPSQSSPKEPSSSIFKNMPITNEDMSFLMHLKNECDTINAHIIETIYLIEKNQEKSDINHILALIYTIESLISIFKESKNENIKEELENIFLKLEFVSKNTGILNKTEIQELKSKFYKIVDIITSIFTSANFNVLDYHALAQEKLKDNEKTEDEKKEQNLTPTFLAQDLLEKISNLETSCELADIIIDEIKNQIKKYENTPIVKIFEKIIEILNKIKTQKIRPNEETLNILKQSIHLIEKLINDDMLSDKEDIGLLLQSLDITEQMITLKQEEYAFNEPIVKAGFQQEENKKTLKLETPEVFQIFESTAIKTLRVDTHKLDKLVNQIGEVIISKIKTKKNILELEEINNRLIDLHEFASKSQKYMKYYDRKIAQVEKDGDFNLFMNFNKQFLSYWNENQSRLLAEIKAVYALHKHMQEDDAKLTLVVNKLEQMVKDIRLLPLATIFHMIPRMVRDIAKEKGKEINLTISGSETNADKKIIEEIKTPLIHIIRNAIDHGIELPNERLAAGKEPTGRIHINARHSENKIIIEVHDDGRGVNLEKIRQKAIAKGLLTFDEMKSMTDEQLMNLIFWPGFSTEETVTDISGRGVGLDIVQTKIMQLNGIVKVQSIIGQGTKLVIELPVTMATIKSFIVKLNQQSFAIPVSTIKAVVKISKEDIYLKDGKDNILYQKTSVPIFNLSKILGFPANVDAKDKKTILLIETENNIIGLEVEELIGDQEILNKELAPPLFKLKNISGITTLVNGDICLIINVSEILKSIITNDYKLISSTAKNSPLVEEFFDTSLCNVLVVDDFMTTRVMLKNILCANGYNVDIANDAVEGLERITHKNYDMIISDIEMPHMTGFEFAEKIKNYDMTAHIPVMLISSLNSDEYKTQAKQCGTDMFISKHDFNQDYFLRSIKYLIQKRKKNKNV